MCGVVVSHSRYLTNKLLQRERMRYWLRYSFQHIGETAMSSFWKPQAAFKLPEEWLVAKMSG